ncbi:hypothetical protein [Paraburkholderia tropica]|uniref:hypothetical protein n=1 Tax=Paraburkholderia tropica TaxID=92647 RepID=UPI001609BBB6|nr:hypothetical protein [Paraburkholderia tropica]MBB6320601.1 hypothetical protein [Paraburkholderia tropica]
MYAIVENGVVINVIVWDGESEWSAPAGTSAIRIEAGVTAAIGYTYANGIFSAPVASSSGE